MLTSTFTLCLVLDCSVTDIREQLNEDMYVFCPEWKNKSNRNYLSQMKGKKKFLILPGDYVKN